jgi:DNA-binding GntR family transcriptional regulator
MTPDDILNLREFISQQEQAIHMKDYDTLARLDMRFHEYICIKAGHSRLL